MKRKFYSVKLLSIFLSTLFFVFSATSVSAANINQESSVYADTTDESLSSRIEAYSKGYVNASDVNLRSGASTDDSVIICIPLTMFF